MTKKSSRAKAQQGRTVKPSKQPLVLDGSGKYTLREVVDKIGKAIPKGTFSAAGSLLGGSLGGPGGAIIGRAAGQMLSGLTGYGEYVLNDLVHERGRPKMPSSDSARTIVHSEFVSDLVSPGSAFNATTFQCNIGDSTLHPWGSKIGSNFTKYRYRQFVLEFRSTTSDYVAGGAMGSVVVSPCYNVNMGTPATKQIMEAQSGAVSTKPSNSLLCGVECNSKLLPQTSYFIRNSTDAQVTQWTDGFEVNVATSGLSAPAGTVLGELWVHYSVDLYEPQLTLTNGVNTTLTARYVGTNNYIDTLVGGPWFAASTSGNTAAAVAGQLPSNFILNQYIGPPPQGVSYTMSFDASDRLKVYFGRPGTYMIDCNRLYNVGWSAGSGNPWSYVLSDTQATLSQTYAAVPPVGGGPFMLKWIITIPKAGTSLQLVANATYTGSPVASGATNLGAYITQLV